MCQDIKSSRDSDDDSFIRSLSSELQFHGFTVPLPNLFEEGGGFPDKSQHVRLSYKYHWQNSRVSQHFHSHGDARVVFDELGVDTETSKEREILKMRLQKKNCVCV